MFSEKDNTKVEQLKIETKLGEIYKEAKEYRDEGEDGREPIFSGELLKKAHAKYLHFF